MRNKRFLALFFAMLFFLIKMAGLHALTHDNGHKENHHCELCDDFIAANLVQLVPLDASAFFQVKTALIPLKQNTFTARVKYVGKILRSNLFGRPPPHLP